jgi:hypothetical protein
MPQLLERLRRARLGPVAPGIDVEPGAEAAYIERIGRLLEADRNRTGRAGYIPPTREASRRRTRAKRTTA